MGMVTIGADIGQKRDPSAIAVADAEMRLVDGRPESFYRIRYLERLPLGTGYGSPALLIHAVLWHNILYVVVAAVNVLYVVDQPPLVSHVTESLFAV